jgi:hypothetical protein
MICDDSWKKSVKMKIYKQRQEPLISSFIDPDEVSGTL